MSGQGNNGNTNGGKPPIGSLGPVNLPYWKLIGNSVDSGAFAGTTNNFPFKIKVNNVLRASFTNIGMDLDGNLHSTFSTVDSILTTWRIMVNDAIAAKTVNASQFLQNDTLVNLVGMQSAIGAHDTSITSLWNHFSTITPSQWTNVGPGFISYNGDVSISGNLQSNSITTMNINITESIKTKSAEFDTLRVAERMQVDKYIQSDTLHALSSLEVNNSLRLRRDTSVMYAEMSTKDTAVALMLQKDASAAVTIGEALPLDEGKAMPKLSVNGNTLLNGNLDLLGDITAVGKINASGLGAISGSLNCNGNSSFRVAYNYTGIIDGCSTASSTWDLNAIKENDIDHRFSISTPDYAGNIFTLTKLGRTGFGTINPQAKVEINEPDEFSTATVFKIHRNGFYGSGNIMEVTKRDKYATNPPLSLFTIKDTGNVGIGISDPQALLDVNGTGHFLKLGIGIANPQLKLHVYGDEGSSGGLRLENSNNNISSAWDFNPVVENSTGRLMIGTPGDPLFAITADDGVNIKSKLNIGSLTPNPTTYDLTIHNGTSANLSSIQLANASSGNTPMDGLVMSSSAGDAVFSLMEDGDYRFGSGNPMTGQFNEKMVIKANGKIGIGTSDPSEKLDVKGNIRINENDIFFRSLLPGGNHGLGWYGDPDNNSQTANSKSFASVDIDGPVLFGFKGGALGSTENGKKIALRWDQKGYVGIGTFLPLEKLQIGNIFTFHDGGNKVIARNFYFDDLNNGQIKELNKVKQRQFILVMAL